MTDFESQAAWLDQLSRLNAVIATAGQPLVGNLFYDHLQSDYASSPPNPILKPKRDRFRQAVAGCARLLEIGVNGGHSAFLALTSNPALEFHGVDICEHAYVKPAVDWLKQEFPGRVFFYKGDCRAVLPRLARDGRTFDAFHVVPHLPSHLGERRSNARRGAAARRDVDRSSSPIGVPGGSSRI